MATLGGLELRERWADWNQTPFTADCTSHVWVWQKPHRQGVLSRNGQPSEQDSP